MGMNFKVYVAGLYTQERLLEADDEPHLSLDNNNENMMHFDFTFLRAVGQSKVAQVWQQQLDHSVTYTYDAIV